MNEKRGSAPLDTERLIPTYFRLSLPVVLSSIVTIVYNLADTYFIARTGNALLIAGVSLCAPIFMILMAFGNLFGQGGSSLVSRLLGQEKRETAARVSAFCFWIALIVGAVLGGLLLLLREPFLLLLGASPDTLPYAKAYGTVMLLGAPLVVLNFIHMNLLRCEGMSGLSMAGSVLGSVVNVILDPLLIPGLGAQGAALATLAGYFCTDLFHLLAVLRRSKALSVRFVLGIEWPLLKDILFIGVTAAITNIAGSVCTILLNQKLLVYGDVRIAAMGIAHKVTMIVQMILIGFSFGGVPLFGFLSGAGEREKIRRLLRFCLVFLCAVTLSITLAICLTADPLLRLLTPDGELVRLGIPMLRWQTAGSVFAGLVLLMTCLCQAAGKGLPALILSLSRQGVIFVLVLLAAAAVGGYTGVLLSQFAADLLSALLALGILWKCFSQRES